MSNANKVGGFVLVEAIAALGVAAIAAAALMTALSSANIRSAEASIRMSALRQAEALLAEAVASPTSGGLETRGSSTRPKLSWTRRLGAAEDAYPDLQRVTVEVNWAVGPKKGVTRLEAYRVAPRN